MKKILHVIPTLKYGGISSVVCNWHDSSHGSQYVFDYVAFNDGPLKEKFTKEGSQVTIIPTLRKNPFAYVYQLVNIILKGRYDGIHIHNSFKNGLALFLAKLLGVKVRVCHSHTSGLENKSLKKYLPFLKWLATHSANKLLACGRDAGLFLYNDKSFIVIKNTIDVSKLINVNLSRQETMRKYNIPTNKKLIGHVGRFSLVKNHNFIIDIASEMDEQYHFVLVGSGPRETEIRYLINKRELSDRFTFIAPTTEVPEILNIFTSFLLPSWFEGVSLALLEAQAASLNCIVSDRVPRENDVGLGLISFLTLDDVNEWVEKIVKLKVTKKTTEEIEQKFYLAGHTNASLVEAVKDVYE